MWYLLQKEKLVKSFGGKPEEKKPVSKTEMKVR
jgi:hypothetical protein